MEVRGENQCFICDNTFRWMATVQEVGKRSYCVREDEVVGEIIALGHYGDQKEEIAWEVIVFCPACHNRNKFITSTEKPK